MELGVNMEYLDILEYFLEFVEHLVLMEHIFIGWQHWLYSDMDKLDNYNALFKYFSIKHIWRSINYNARDNH